ncbi:MAG: POTRA domain-containing protein [Acidobacteriota bacterium]|nr:POTRA domain-containing protein [Acidobacteriota bacterium]
MRQNGVRIWTLWLGLLVWGICSPAARGQSVPAQAAPLAAAAKSTVTAQNAPATQLPGTGTISEEALPGARAVAMLGRTLESVRVVTTRTDQENAGLLARLPLKAGGVLDRESLRLALQRLFASGRFAAVEAEVTLLDSGRVALEFHTQPYYFNGEVTVSGLPRNGPSDVQAIHAGQLELGVLFSEASLKDSEERIERLLRDSGYFQAKVTARQTRHAATQQVDVEFVIQAGAPAKVGKFAVSGDAGISNAEAVALCRMSPGRRVRGDLLQKAVARLRKRYIRQRRLRAQLTAGVPVFHAESNSVDYVIEVTRGPVVDVRAEGFPLRKGRLRRLVPIFEEHAVDEDLLNEGRRKLRDYLQGQGYFDATVQVRQNDAANGEQYIVYAIQAGRQRHLRAVAIDGNHRFESATLRERMSTQVASALVPYGHYSQALISSDLDSIKSLYLSNGYPDVKVASEVQDDGAEDMKVLIHVNEGPLVLVSKLALRGAQKIGEEELRGLINTRAGQPFSEATINDDREALLNHYFNRGFPQVQLETTAQYSDAAHTQMEVAYEIKEGPQEFVNHVLISGVQYTRPHIVNRAITIHDGAPLSQEKMLRTQRNLYDLGIFNEVQTAVQNPDGDEPRKDLLFQIKEARRWTIEYGGGLEIATGLNVSQGGSAQGETGVSPRVTLNVTRINFRGRDQSLIFRSHFGNLQKRASLSFEQPRWFDLPNWKLTLTALYDNTRDVNTFSSSRTEGSVQLTEKATHSTELIYRYAYRLVKVDPNSFPAGFSPDLIPIYSRAVRVGMPTITYLRDTRDDPLSSTKGTYTTFDIGVASGYFGSEANFGRIVVQHASYHKLRRGWVFARSTRIGVEMPYGTPCTDVSSTSGGCPSEVRATGYVPLPERFFMGGSNSHRGFAINQAGPRDPDSGAPLGGDAMFLNNLELRLPPMVLPYVRDNLSFVLFHDIGNDFSSANEMWKNLTRMNQKNQASCRDLSATATCDFSYMSQAVGTGVRYHTPIGPVRVDMGYNLNPPYFPVKDPCADVTSGCTAVPHIERVRRFNFFFSIGQTF